MTEDIKRPSRRKLGLAAAALLLVGGAGGAITVAATRHGATMAPATPVAISSLKSDDGIVTIRGKVAEIFGNKVVMQDASGRALVDLGREGEDGALVSAGQSVTVQGRFEHGFMHAGFLVGADGKVTALGPMHGPGDHSRKGRHHGPEGDRDDGPDRDDDRAPPPPPVPAAAAPAPSAPAAAPTPATK